MSALFRSKCLRQGRIESVRTWDMREESPSLTITPWIDLAIQPLEPPQRYQGIMVVDPFISNPGRGFAAAAWVTQKGSKGEGMPSRRRSRSTIRRAVEGAGEIAAYPSVSALVNRPTRRAHRRNSFACDPTCSLTAGLAPFRSWTISAAAEGASHSGSRAITWRPKLA